MSWRRVAGIVAGSVIVLALAGWLAADALARRGLEQGLERAFGTPASVESVDVGLFSGEVSARGLVVSNPEGEFRSPRFAALARMRATAGLGDLWGDTVVIRRVELEGLELHLERRGTATNFGPILASVEESRASAGEGERRYRIGELVLRDVAARVRLGSGESAGSSVSIPEIRLTDVGSGEGGATLTQVAGAVLEAALRGALRRSGTPAAVVELLRSRLGGLGTLPGGLELRLPDPDEEGEGAGERVRDALEEVLPGGGSG